jgi:hypothetical protein
MGEREERLERHKEDGWIGVDLDGTLAKYDGWVDWDVIGEPIPEMVNRVKKWLADGYTVKIFTARVGKSYDKCKNSERVFWRSDMVRVIKRWCCDHVGQALEVTCVKDVDMIELWDDRAIQVIPNTGKTLAEEFEAELSALRGKP